MELSEELVTDDHPGAIFLRNNLVDIRRGISDRHSSQLLLVPDEFVEKQWQGAAGVTIACGCVHVQFMYIRPKYRNSEMILRLFEKIAEVGQSASYGYVMVHCPVIDGLESLHEFCSVLSQAQNEEPAPAGEMVRIYSIPKSDFESVL